jgi:hypothetical protein
LLGNRWLPQTTSTWQNPYIERLIGTIRREFLHHMIVFGQARLRLILDKWIHRSLDIGRPVRSGD